jgi:ABC-2 type transport system permease protein
MTSTTVERPAGAPGRPRPREEAAARNRWSVWWRVYRHELRLLRSQSIAWILVVAGTGMLVVAGFQSVYETQAQRDAAAASIEGVPAFEALFGRTVALATVEGFVLWRWGGFAVLLVAIWGLLACTKARRGAEEAGHAEALRAGAITPRGLIAATLGALFTVFLLLAAAVGVSHAAAGMDAATAWAMGLALGMLAATFAAVGAVTSQIASTRRQANGMGAVVLGLLLGLRILAAGTGTPDWLWGVTPFGWASYLHEVDDARVPVFVAYSVLVAALVTATLLLGRRDLHAGLIGRAGSVDTARPVRSLTGLVVRQTRGPMLTWGGIVMFSALVFGLLADDFAEAFGDLEGTVAAGEQIGFVALDTPEGVVSSLVLFLALVGALFGAAQAANIREEEASWRIEALLVRTVGRTRWLGTRLGIAALAIVLLAVITAVSAWLGTVLVGSEASIGLGDIVLQALNLIPIAWMFLGLGLAAFGLVPRLTASLGYALVLTAYVIDLIGGLLELPETVLELSPFRHLTAVPVADPAVVPLSVMVLVGMVAAGAGAIGFRRRDLQEA